MIRRRALWTAIASVPILASFIRKTSAQTPAPATSPTGGPGMEMLTLILRHDQSKTQIEITEHLKKTGWFKDFPPPGVEVVSWYVMMGIGQVVTLRFPAERLRDINRVVENEAWGGFRTEFFATYDFKSIYKTLQESNR